MKYQKDENYKPLKLPWAVKLSPLILLAGAFTLGAVEGAVEGWNYESMEKQKALTKKFERKYEAIKRNYQINGENIEEYFENEKIQ